MTTLSTNFNVSPYFDDYNEDKDFYRILFRPSVAVQARELTQLQTILQNQIQRFGEHVFKDGSIVDGCGIIYRNKVSYISLANFFNTNTNMFVSDLNSSYVITNSQDSNVAVRASILIAKDGFESEYPNTNRLYLDYYYSGQNTSGGEQSEFLPGDTLYIYSSNQNRTNTLDSNNFVDSIETLATNGSFTSNGVSFCIQVTDGTIYQKGFFSRVNNQVITVNDFSTNVDGYVVGFETTESIVNENTDESISDNALGYPNENAPGAHRLKLEPKLVSKLKTDTANLINFFSIVEFDGRQPTIQKDNPQYAAIMDEFSKRTYEESGDYYIKPYNVESILSSNSSEFTYSISPGLSYVRGVRIEKVGNETITVPRAINVDYSQNEIIKANYGNYIFCNEFLGMFDTEQIDEVSLYDTAQRSLSEYEGITATPIGSEVGKANIRSVIYHSGDKNTSNALYKVYLFNIRMNSGKSFSSDVKSIYGTSGSFGGCKADIVLENSKAVLKNIKTRTLFDTKIKAVKTLTNNTGIGDTFYNYTQIKSGTLASDGTITISIDTAGPGTGTERLLSSTIDDYIITASTNAYSSNLSGTIAYTSGSVVFTGTSTSFDTELAANSNIRIYDGTSYHLRRVVSIQSSTELTVDNGINGSNTGANFQQYYVEGTSFPIESITLNSNTSFTANLSLSTASLDSGSMTVHCSYPVNRNLSTEIPKDIKKNRYVKIDCSNNTNGSVGPWNLGLVDVHKINNIFVGAAYSNSSTDRSSWFVLNRGHKDNYYEHSSLIIKPEYASQISASTKLFIDLDHFVANTNQSVGYFSVESYPIDDVNTSNTNAIQTIDIPFDTLDRNNLRNYIDFRPQKYNTANSVANGDVSNTFITINPASNNDFNVPASGQYIIRPDTNFTADFEYYLPRIDVITLDQQENFKVIQGEPSTTPRIPFVDSDSSKIAVVNVPAFPSVTVREKENYSFWNQIAVKLVGNKRYTMSDIGTLENRLKRVEYYTLLNALEQSAKDLTVPDQNGLNRFKNGIFADPFNNHNNGKVDSFEYKIAIDGDRKVARPSISSHTEDLKFNLTNSTSVQKTGVSLTLPYNSETFINQSYASKFRNCAEAYWQWNGSINLYPSYHFNRDEEISPNQVVNLDLARPWEQFAQSPFAQRFGDWRVTNNTWVENTPGLDSRVGVTMDNLEWRGNEVWRRARVESQRVIESLGVSVTNETIDLGSYLQDITIQPYMASRLVAFEAYNLKPNSIVHAFFDDINVDEHCAVGVLSGINDYADGREDQYIRQTGSFGGQLLTDSTGTIRGVFRIPAQTFRTGDRVFQLTNVDDLVTGADARIVSAKATFTADNVSVTRGSTTINVRQPQLFNRQTVQRQFADEWRFWRFDPIAQSFSMPLPDDNSTGFFLTEIGVYFKKKDPSLGVTLLVTEMRNNQPDDRFILEQTHLTSSEVSVSDDGSVETRFVLTNPIYCLSDNDYCFMIQPDSNSSEYEIWVAETGNFDTITQEQIYSNPYSGMMFISANRKTWTSFQKEDIKFKIYRANFTETSGTAVFNNQDNEYLNVDQFNRVNTSIGINVGDIVLTVNSSGVDLSNNDSIVSNTLTAGVTGLVSYINEAEGKITLNTSTAIGSNVFSNTTNPTIAIYSLDDTSNLNSISATNLVAFANVSLVEDKEYHMIVPSFGVLQPSGTNLTYANKGVSNTNVIDSLFISTRNNEETEFIDYERILKSKSNEIVDISGQKSIQANVNLTSTSNFLSPVIDLSKKMSLFVENIINNDATDEDTRYGNSLVRYISETVVLDEGQDAEDLKVYLTAYRPADTDILVYAKLLNNEDVEDFDDKKWTLLKYANDGDLINSSSVDSSDYIEYEFEFDNVQPKYANGVSIPQTAFANTGRGTLTKLTGGVDITEGSNIITGKKFTFNANTDVDATAETIAISDANTYFQVGDKVTYGIESGNTALTNLVDNNIYYVSHSNTTTIAISETRSSANINLTKGLTESGHFFTGTRFLEDFIVGDKIRVESDDYFAIPDVISISNNTSLTVDVGLLESNASSLYYVYNENSGDGIVEYDNLDGSRYVGFKQFAIKIVLLSSNPIRVPILNDVRVIALQI